MQSEQHIYFKRGVMSQARRVYSGGIIILVSMAAGFLLTRSFTRYSEAPPHPAPSPARYVQPPDNVIQQSSSDEGEVSPHPAPSPARYTQPSDNESQKSSSDEDEASPHPAPSPARYTQPSDNESQQSSSDEVGDAKNMIFDMSRPYVRMWPDDEDHCGRKETRFGLNTDWAWLISYPRSGNTWTRYLLEASTGVFTGSVYSSDLLKGMQYLGENENPYSNTTVVVKTHKLPKDIAMRAKPAIMLIRNPERSILSFWNWKKVDSRERHTASVSNDTLFSPEFLKFASRQISTWERHYSNWIKNLPHLLPVYYEFLRDDPVGHVLKMLSFMKVNTNEERLSCVSGHLDGRVKGGQRTVSPYTPEQKSRLKNAVKNISNQLQARGFPALPIYENYKS